MRGSPAAPDAWGEQATRPRSGADQESSVRLLIAHGSQAAQEALADSVQRSADEPLEIVTASEGSEALELLLQDDPPEVALVDWDLPAIEGPEMCRLVRDFHHGHDTWLVVLAALAAHRHSRRVAGRRGCLHLHAGPSRARCARAWRRACARCARRAAERRRRWPVPLTTWVRLPDDRRPGDAGRRAPARRHRRLLRVRRGRAAGDRTILTRGLEPAAAAARPEPDEPRGAALLQAVLGER